MDLGVEMPQCEIAIICKKKKDGKFSLDISIQQFYRYKAMVMKFYCYLTLARNEKKYMCMIDYKLK